MKNFARALRDALNYWSLLLLAILCSVGAAALWGGNIGALYPVIEVAIAGEPLQGWIAREIAQSQRRIDELSSQIEMLEKQPGLDRDIPRQLQVEHLQSNLAAEQTSLRSSRALQPWIDRWLPADPFRTVVAIVGLLMLGTVVKQFFLLVNAYAVARVASHIARDVRVRVFRTAIHMDQSTFSFHGSSGFVAHISHSAEMLSNGITNVYGGAIREPLKLLSCLLGAAFICWRLLLLSLIVAPVVVLLITWLGRRIKSICRRLLENALGLHHVMQEALGNLRTVQAFSNEAAELKRFERATYDMQRFSLRIAFYDALTRPVTELLGVGILATAILAGSYLVLNRETHILGVQVCTRPLSVASVLVFFGLLVGASDPIRKLSTVLSGINAGVIAADMLYPILDRPSYIRDPEKPVSVARPHRELEFRDVTFAYDGRGPALKNVSVSIPFGSKVAIVGPNGSGKSSFVNLLCRYYDPQHGSVALDGVDLRSMRLADLRGRIGLVTQNTELFNEDIYYNIGYGSAGCSRERIVQVAKMAHAHEFIVEALPDGYETVLGQNGHRLSGGQRQRIALARAMLRDPEILILDEATSQIDLESERLIQNALVEFARNRTVVFITHRTTMREIADITLELDEGRVKALRGACRNVA